MSNAKVKAILAAHKKMIKTITGRKVEAGWFESARYKKRGNILVAQVARYNEFGTRTIPARPFMRLAGENFARDRAEIQLKITKQLMAGKISVDQALGKIGLAMEGKIAESIKNGQWVPNAESTHKRKGFAKNTPLIWTGTMLKTIASRVS